MVGRITALMLALVSMVAFVGPAEPALGASTDSQPPTAPSSLRTTAVTDTSIGIGWAASSDDVGVTGYGVYLNGTKVSTTQAVSANVSGLACGTSYTLAVDAFDAAGNHSAATSITASTAACAGPVGDSQAPTAPSSLRTTAVTDTSIGIGWAASSDNVGVTGYGVYLNGTKVSDDPGRQRQRLRPGLRHELHALPSTPSTRPATIPPRRRSPPRPLRVPGLSGTARRRPRRRR